MPSVVGNGHRARCSQQAVLSSSVALRCFELPRTGGVLWFQGPNSGVCAKDLASDKPGAEKRSLSLANPLCSVAVSWRKGRTVAGIGGLNWLCWMWRLCRPVSC